MSKFPDHTVLNSSGRVVLQPSRSIEGRVTVPKEIEPGKGYGSSGCALRRIEGLVNSIFNHSREMIPFRAWRQGKFPTCSSAIITAQGEFRMTTSRCEARLYLAATGDGLGEAGDWWNPSKTFDEAIRILMQVEGIVSGVALRPRN